MLLQENRTSISWTARDYRGQCAHCRGIAVKDAWHVRHQMLALTTTLPSLILCTPVPDCCNLLLWSRRLLCTSHRPRTALLLQQQRIPSPLAGAANNYSSSITLTSVSSRGWHSLRSLKCRSRSILGDQSQHPHQFVESYISDNSASVGEELLLLQLQAQAGRNHHNNSSCSSRGTCKEWRNRCKIRTEDKNKLEWCT